MTRSRGWLLPDPGYEALDRVCVSFEVPNDPEILLAAHYAVSQLAMWSNWEKDPDKRAAPLAHFLLPIIADSYSVSAGECDQEPMYDISITDCTLTLLENGVPKTTIDLTTCAVPGPKGDPGEPGPPGQDCDCSGTGDGSEVPEPEPEVFGKTCDIASYIANQIRSDYLEITADYILNVVDQGQNSLEWMNDAIDRFAIEHALVAVFVSWVNMIDAQANTTFYDFVNTSEFLDAFRCTLYCAMDGDPSITPSTIATWKESMETDYPGSGTSAILRYMETINLGDYRLYAYLGSQTTGADCTQCDCCEGNTWVWNDPRKEDDRYYSPDSFGPEITIPFSTWTYDVHLTNSHRVVVDFGRLVCVDRIRFGQTAWENPDEGWSHATVWLDDRIISDNVFVPMVSSVNAHSYDRRWVSGENWECRRVIIEGDPNQRTNFKYFWISTKEDV
jgi:hypothetical protein